MVRIGQGKAAALIATVYAVILGAGCLAIKPAADMSGEELYTLKCGTRCHQLYPPATHSDAKWEATVKRMAHKVALSSIDIDRIIAFLKAANLPE